MRRCSSRGHRPRSPARLERFCQTRRHRQGAVLPACGRTLYVLHNGAAASRDPTEPDVSCGLSVPRIRVLTDPQAFPRRGPAHRSDVPGRAGRVRRRDRQQRRRDADDAQRGWNATFGGGPSCRRGRCGPVAWCPRAHGFLRRVGGRGDPRRGGTSTPDLLGEHDQSHLVYRLDFPWDRLAACARRTVRVRGPLSRRHPGI